MTTAAAFTVGQAVTFTGRMGVCTSPFSRDFLEHVVTEKGQLGRYFATHPDEQLANQGWHLCTIRHNGRTLYVPVHVGHFVA